MIYSLLLIGFIIQIFFISASLRKEYIQATILKTAASLTFIIVALSSNNKMLTIALIFGGIGDLLLELRHLFKKALPLFVVGTFFFIFEHIILISKCFSLCNNHLTVALLVSLLMSCLIHIIMRNCFRHEGKGISILGAIYLCFLSVLISFSFIGFLYNKSIENLLFFIGSIFFTTSDCLLITHNFGKDKYWYHPISLILYFLAQSIIAISITI